MKTHGPLMIEIKEENLYEYEINLKWMKERVVFYAFASGEVDEDNMPSENALDEVFSLLARECGEYIEKNEDDDYRSDICELIGYETTYYRAGDGSEWIEPCDIPNLLQNLIKKGQAIKTGKYFNEFGNIKFEKVA